MTWHRGETEGIRDAFGIAIIIISSLCIAFVPSSAKISMNEGASLFVILVSRCLIGTILLLPVTLVQRRKLLIPRKLLGSAIIATIFNVGMIGFLYSAVKLVDVGLAVLILYMFPLGISILSHLSGRQRLNTLQWGALAGLLAGLLLLMLDTFWAGSVEGLLLSFGAMFCAMIYTTISSDLTDKLGSASANLQTNIWSVVILSFTLFLPLGQEIALPGTTWGWTAILSNGTFYMLGYWLFFEGCRIIGVTRASVLTIVDPLFATIIAILFLGQFLTLIEWTGFSIIVGALLVFETCKSKKTRIP
ncbi:MAG: hypothetical protein CMM73_03115 [Rhodospirillaceae bacterium]|nr:hypothetical protein [Rhodospirillaceae bacterium]